MNNQKSTSICNNYFNYTNMTTILMLLFSLFASSSGYEHKNILATFYVCIFPD